MLSSLADAKAGESAAVNRVADAWGELITRASHRGYVLGLAAGLRLARALDATVSPR